MSRNEGKEEKEIFTLRYVRISFTQREKYIGTARYFDSFAYIVSKNKINALCNKKRFSITVFQMFTFRSLEFKKKSPGD